MIYIIILYHFDLIQFIRLDHLDLILFNIILNIYPFLVIFLIFNRRLIIFCRRQ